MPLQEGSGLDEPCCLDLSFEPLNFSAPNFTLVPGGNFWSPQANQTAEAFEAEVPSPSYVSRDSICAGSP